MTDIYTEYNLTLAKIKELKGKLEQLEIQIWEANQSELPVGKTGTTKINRGTNMVSIVQKEKVSITDPAILMDIEPEIVKIKTTASIDKKNYDALPADRKAEADKYIKREIAKPSFKVEVL